MTTTITCPSGLSGRVRGVKVAEERILADRSLSRDGALVDALLGACWVETLDAGPYEFTSPNPPWDRVLQGDRFFALTQIRAETYGHEYAFSVGCQQRGCGARIEWEVDLTELPVRELSAESRVAFKGGNRFEATLPGGATRIGFKLLVGADERRLAALRRQSADRPLSAVLAYRITDVDGVAARDIRGWLDELSMRDATALARAFDEADCGVETTIEIACPECGAHQEVELPFDRSFFMPGPPKRAPRSSSLL